MMTREEHLNWCKERALAYVADNDLPNAVASMMSDLSKHPGTKDSASPALTMVAMLYVQHYDIDGVRRFIEGFN